MVTTRILMLYRLITVLISLFNHFTRQEATENVLSTARMCLHPSIVQTCL